MREDGKIDYVEMPTADLPAAKRFYGEAFGWTFTDYGPGYSAFDEGLEGGFHDGDEPTGARQPMVILYARDLEAMEAKVRAAGAEITQPIFSFPGGRRFHFRDPGGNEVGVATYD